MRSFAALVAVAIALAGCGPDCAPSGDIQVTLVPSPAVDAGAIARLRIGLSVAGGPTRTLELVPPHRLDAPAAFLLHPDPPPAGRYTVSVTVEALDASGALVEVGGTSSEVSASGCNRLEARLAPLPGTGDGALLDGGSNPDLACGGAGPDEDGDGLPNSCDACPADSSNPPVDRDLDGLPDACDPDPDRAGNKLVYFEPFDAADGHWSGSFQVASSELVIATLSDDRPEVSTNALDSLPAGVRVQTIVHAVYFEGPGPNPPVASDVGLFLGSSSNPGGASTSGMLCTLNRNVQTGDSLDLNVVQNGLLQQPVSQPLQFGFETAPITYRLRLTQRGASYSCEAAASGRPTTTVTAQVAQAPAAPQFLALHAWHVEAHFHSVVAESVLP